MNTFETTIDVSFEAGELCGLDAVFGFRARVEQRDPSVGIFEPFWELIAAPELLHCMIGTCKVSRATLIEMATIVELERVESVMDDRIIEALGSGALEWE